MRQFLALAALLGLANCAGDPLVLGYDEDREMMIWQIVIISLGFLYIVVFLGYTIGRLFFEEGRRFI